MYRQLLARFRGFLRLQTSRRGIAEGAWLRPVVALGAVLGLLSFIPGADSLGAAPVPVALAQAPPAASATTSPPPVDKPEEGGAVVPEGKEEFFAEMFGKGEILAGECKFAGGQVDGPVIHSTYTCGAATVVYELSHPDNAPSGASETERFAVVVQSGSPPAGLTDALVARIRAREAGFEWKVLVPPRSKLPSRPIVLIAAIALLAIVALGWARRRRAAARPPAS